MGKKSVLVDGDNDNNRVAVYSPSDRFLYNVDPDEARYLLKTSRADRMFDSSGDPTGSIRLRVLELPKWMGGVSCVFREFLPSDQAATCWCYSLKDLGNTRDLYTTVTRECLRYVS